MESNVSIEFTYIQLEKLTQNTFIEQFNGTYKRGVLDKYIFENINQAREHTQNWMYDYNHYRPHDSLRRRLPVKYAEINALGTSSRSIKNNNFIEILGVLIRKAYIF